MANCKAQYSYVCPLQVLVAEDWWAEALHLPDSTVLFVDFLSVGPGSEGTKGDEQKEHVKGVAFPAADELLECQVPVSRS